MNRSSKTIVHGPTPVPGRLTQDDVQHLLAMGNNSTASKEALRQKHRVPVSLYKSLLLHYRAPTVKTDKQGHKYSIGIWDEH